MLSLTKDAAVSSAAFQVMPSSFRLMTVDPSNPDPQVSERVGGPG
jgi:hypothetical protein